MKLIPAGKIVSCQDKALIFCTITPGFIKKPGISMSEYKWLIVVSAFLNDKSWNDNFIQLVQ